jgi:uncharacterized repeat protein (TIGR03803 family)
MSYAQLAQVPPANLPHDDGTRHCACVYSRGARAFSGSQDGQLPFTLVQGPDGNFYGTTLWGGGSNGYGIIFKVTPSGEETILQSLTNTNGGPANPAAGLTLGADGNFYGTSSGGGASPHGELIQVKNGEFFGTTSGGGDGGYGTVFKVSATGVLSVLHAFTGGSDGAQPAAPLIHGRDGAFYGTTQAGGTGNCAFPGLPTGCGTVFRVTSGGKESVIHEFAGYPTDGSNPLGGLVQAKGRDVLWNDPRRRIHDSGKLLFGLWHDFFAHPDRYRADSDRLWHAGRPVVCRWLGPLRNTGAQCARHLDRNNSERRRRVGQFVFDRIRTHGKSDRDTSHDYPAREHGAHVEVDPREIVRGHR